MSHVKKTHHLTCIFTFSALGICPFSLAATGTSDSMSDTLIVTARPQSHLAPDEHQEKEKLDNVAGGTNLVIIEQDTRLATLHDALDYQPGILIQDFFGGIDQPRLNIRGSGVQSAPLARGVLLMQDGLPITDADGSFHISTLEMRDARMVSVRRGANSLNPQSNTLGGELDAISWTGRDENGRLRYEYGSFGREGLQAALGGVTEDGRFDGRISLTYDHFDGYRQHSTSQRKTLHSNMGYVTDNFENRTWLSWTDLRFDIAGPASEKGVNTNPTTVLKPVLLLDPKRYVEQFRVANRSDWQIGNQQLGLGIWHIHTHDDFITPLYFRLGQSHSEGAQLTWNTETALASYHAALAWDHMALKTDLTRRVPFKALVGRYHGRAENIYASLGAGLHMTTDLTLNLEAKVTHAIRDVEKRNSNISLNQNWTFWTPKAGIIWRPANNQRYFANISTSQEPVTFWEIIDSISGKLSKLSPQKGISFEVGGEGELSDSLKWDLTFYRSMITDEYIITYDSQGNIVGISNYAARTRHQGLEAGLKGEIPVGPGDVGYRISWTYNDFRFMGGEYNNNYIADIPRNTIAAEVLYNIGQWRFGPNLHWSPTDMAIDHENHLDIQKRKHYAVFGFKGSWHPVANWSLYLSLDNLTNERYATTSIATRALTSDKDGTLFPGMGFSVNGGMTYLF